jgi:hypothetical protein
LLAALYVSTLSDGTYIGQLFVSLKALAPNVGGVAAFTVTLDRLLQLLKALAPIFVTPLGISILVRLVQPWKA